MYGANKSCIDSILVKFIKVSDNENIAYLNVWFMAKKVLRQH